MGKQNNKNNKPDKKKSLDVKKQKNNWELPSWLPYIIIIISTVALYYQTVDFDLVECDDHEIIGKDFERISKIGNWDKEFSKSYMHNSYYRPLVNISFMLNAKMSGQNLSSYHITNFVLHTMNVTLIFLFLGLIGFKKLPALIASLLYAVHPLLTNSVAWIVGRNDLLFSLFSLISLILMIYFINKKNWFFLVLHGLSFLLALLSKETALVIPVLFSCYIFLFKKEFLKSKSFYIILCTWIIANCIWLLLRYNAELGESVYRTGLDVFLFNWAMPFEFVAKFFIPIHLSVLPTYSLLNTTIGIAVVLILVLIIYKTVTFKNKSLIFGSIWFSVLIIPGMFISLLNAHEWNEYLECRAYLASFGLLIISLELTSRLWERNEKTMLGICLLLILTLGYLTFVETRNYKDPPSYYESAVADDSNRASFHYILGQLYYNRLFKQTKEEMYLKKSADEIEQAVKLRPNHALYYQSLGAVYSNANEYQKAINNLDIALTLDSNVLDSYNGLGMNFYLIGEAERAVAIWRLGLTKWPADQNLLYNISDVYFKSINPDSALHFAIKSFTLDNSEKNRYEIYFLLNKWGGFYIQQGFYKYGLMVLNAAVKIEPTRYAAYENLMNYYLMIENKPEIAAYYAKKLNERGRKLDEKVFKFLEPYLN